MGKILGLVDYKSKNDPIFNVIKKKNKGSLKEVEMKLNGWGVEYEVKNPNHIKIGSINYYISTGTCYVDGMGGKFKKKGITFLKQILQRGGLI